MGAGPLAGPPSELTSYVGRARELRDALRLLATGRLVTLTGPGGMGKTRLAIRVMSAASGRFPDSAVFVELAELRDPSLLVTLLVDRLGLQGHASGTAEELVLNHLRDRRMLLVLDNCEHLVTECARVVDLLVRSAPELVVLATSRQSLRVDGENLLPVLSLSVPADLVAAADDLASYESVRLFLDRATAVLPSFTVTDKSAADVAWICHHLDGLPLAIELAAARMRSLSVRQVADRLRRRLPALAAGASTAPERHQTLDATIDWSYELCSPGEQTVWRRATVFSGSFDLAAAERVCGGRGVASREVLDLIDGLLDKSILVREEERGIVRYRMLETLRQYGHQRLDAAGESARVARAHRDWYVDLMIRFGQQWLGPDQVAWVHRMRIDNPNLRAAAEFSLSEPGESVVLARMGMASQQYWSVVGFQEGARVWIERALATMPEDAPEYGDTLWLCGLASLLRAQLPLAAERLTASGEIAQRTGNEVLGARVTTTWGLACVFGGDYERAVALLTPALATLEAHRVGESEFLARWQLGMAQGLGGDLDAARVTLADGLARSAECGEICFRGWLLNASAQVESAHGQLDAARSAALRALGLQRELGDLFALAMTTSVLAFITVRHDDFTRAATLLGIAESLWTSIGATPAVLPVFGRGFARNRERAAEALGPERFANAMARGAAMTRDEGLRYALDEADPLVTVTDDESALLTKRENEVAELVSEGLTNREIAAKLTIAPRTAETHVDHILTKLGFRTRTQVAGWVAARRLNR